MNNIKKKKQNKNLLLESGGITQQNTSSIRGKVEQRRILHSNDLEFSPSRNQKMNTPMVQSTLSCPSSYNVTANNNNNNNIALTLDQTQLQQITQLMNEMQQQDLNFNANNNAIENTNISIDVTHHTNHTENGINQNQLIFSPDSIVKLENNIQFQQATAYQMTPSITNQALVDNQQQQQQLTQVHTIMLNGQPALFIPASSAMSSNLLSQMLMNNNGGALVNPETQSSTINTTHNINNSNNNQAFDLNSINLPFNSG